MTKFVSVILLIAILCSCTLVYASAEESNLRASDYFTSYGTSMSAVGSGRSAITFRAVGTDICNQIGVATYCVQKLNDDGEWVYCSGQLSGQTGTNVASYTFGRYFQGVAGETYRIQVTFFCSIGTGSEHKSYTSGKVTAK